MEDYSPPDLWYYTSLIELEEILKNKRIYGEEPAAKDGLASVTIITSNPEWEPSNTWLTHMNAEAALEKQLVYLGFARIGIEYSHDLLSWEEYLETGVSPSLFNFYDKVWPRNEGIERFCTFDIITSMSWESVEYYNGHQWITLKDDGSDLPKLPLILKEV